MSDQELCRKCNGNGVTKFAGGHGQRVCENCLGEGHEPAPRPSQQDPIREAAMAAAAHRRMRWEAACAALTGLLAAEANPQAQGYPRPSDEAAAYRFADSALELADALIARFERGEETGA